MDNNDIDKLFLKENSVLDAAKKFSKTKIFSKSQLHNEYDNFINQYERLLKQFQKLLKISEYYEKLLEQKNSEINKLNAEKNKILEEEVLKQNEELKLKNNALVEILNNFQSEKDNLKEIVFTNLELLFSSQLIKIIHEVEIGRKDKALKYLAILEKNLTDFTDPFTSKFKNLKFKLSPKEFQICEFIRSGLLAKEIASMMNITEQAIKWHKKNITNKLELNKHNIKLKNYLMKL